MSLIKLVLENNVLALGMKLVKRAKKSLDLTMMLDDELTTTSKEYTNLLKKKINQGLEIRRIGFGDEKGYQKALKQLGFETLPDNFFFVLCSDTSLYQRLLISDKKKMLFAVYTDKNKKMVFYTKCKQIIDGFINYFNLIFCKTKNY